MKRIVITGINRGLGKELFEVFCSRGYFVYGILRNKLEAQQLRKVIPINCEIIVCDLSNDSSITAIKESVGENQIDLLVNNAGIGGRAYQIENLETSEISDLFNIHCLGVLRTVKALLENLLKSSNPIVINLNSRLGSISRQNSGLYKDLDASYSYRIAKASQNMLTVCMRNEFKNRIQFISLHPGKMKTAIASSDADIEPREIAHRILEFYDKNKLKEENGIIELDNELIEW